MDIAKGIEKTVAFAVKMYLVLLDVIVGNNWIPLYNNSVSTEGFYYI